MFVTMLRRLSASRWLLAPHVLRPSRHTVSVYSSIDKHRTNPILGRNTVKSCSDTELFPRAMTSVTRSCHGLAPLHGPLSKRATATLAPTYTFPLD